ncbi:hypothetical protein CLOSTASPAR_06362 [[Clostridium] asparagiforme DSM 15981]|uniref:Uncharacterized protein n=1 Tax=[Clostridium] asparagiforme DSM 15981 TaxID=518636 RepID=C0DAQ7_9FIRM|nr:hypothetical protein CLOSTASPAR_06362 [[Clostridium] asparagiforme DSM 15981]
MFNQFPLTHFNWLRLENAAAVYTNFPILGTLYLLSRNLGGGAR